MPHKGINALEFGSEAVAAIQKRFYQDFPAHEQEQVYAFATPSTMKPTQIKIAEGGVNQLPPWVEIQGDIRLTPFYNAAECQKTVERYVAELNEQIASGTSDLPTRGMYILP